MAIDVKITVQSREKTGTSECRRLRRQGLVPGNIYGNGHDAAAFSANADEITKLINAGHRALNVDLNGKSELAIFRDIQWDTFGTYLQHVDLLIIDPTRRVQVEVPVILRGIAAGTQVGGVAEQLLNKVTVDCPLYAVPKSIFARVARLQIGDELRVKEIELPDETILQSDAEAVVVRIAEPKKEAEKQTEETEG